MPRLSNLSIAALQARLEKHRGDPNDTLLHELQIHEIELELRNRELQIAQQQVETSRDRYAKLYDAAPIGYAQIDDKGVIRGINLAGAELLRRPRIQIIGTPMMSFLIDSSLSRWYQFVRRWRIELRSADELEVLTGDKRIVPVQMVSASSRPEFEFKDADEIYLVAIIDISDRKRAEMALQRAHDELDQRVKLRTSELQTANVALKAEVAHRRELEQMLRERAGQLKETNDRKDEFLAMLSHELRNPLAALRIGFELIKRQQSPDTDEGASLYKMMDRQFKQLVRLIDDLLDVSRISNGCIRLQMEVLDLREVVEDAISSARGPLELRRHHLSTPMPKGPLWVKGDVARLHQVALNLLLNAIKFTDPGGRLCVALKKESGEAVLCVSDNGRGIAPQLLPRIFEAFVQGESSIARSMGGLGLGLALVQRLVELHGGQVDASSAGLGRGSEFTVRLPMAKSSQMLRRLAGKPAGAKPVHCLRILLVDDNEDLTETVANLLRSWGHEVDVANDGQDAVRVARRFVPELAFVDIGLPIMDGYAVASALRQQAETQHAGLVALSGYGGAEYRERAIQAGFSDYLTKPLAPEALQDFIARWASRLTEASAMSDGDFPSAKE